METLLQKLIDLVQQTAPELWRIALRQITVQQYQNLIGFILLLVFIVCAVLMAVKLHKWRKIKTDKSGRADTSVEDLGMTFISIAVLLALISEFYSLMYYIGTLINPEYYAIQVLLQMVK